MQRPGTARTAPLQPRGRGCRQRHASFGVPLAVCIHLLNLQRQCWLASPPAAAALQPPSLAPAQPAIPLARTDGGVVGVHRPREQEKWMEEDVRDALVRQKTTGEYTAAYKQTQPVTEFRAPTPESDEDTLGQ